MTNLLVTTSGYLSFYFPHAQTSTSSACNLNKCLINHIPPSLINIFSALVLFTKVYLAYNMVAIDHKWWNRLIKTSTRSKWFLFYFFLFFPLSCWILVILIKSAVFLKNNIWPSLFLVIFIMFKPHHQKKHPINRPDYFKTFYILLNLKLFFIKKRIKIKLTEGWLYY